VNREQHQKVTVNHLKRLAYLYVRQSTLRQVFENTESTKRQYGLRERAVALGWEWDRVVVIDSDLGQSGADSDREGFQKLVAAVGLGEVGVVLGLEVSRLGRSSADWHRLLEICALTDTLILDEDGLYNPAHFNDRLLLGLKGTMSEAELHVLRARLLGGQRAKASRGYSRCGCRWVLSPTPLAVSSSTPTSRSRPPCALSSRPSGAPARQRRPCAASVNRVCSFLDD
jgi:DNA invertase Pin-like site-specific DNA recombinase